MEKLYELHGDSDFDLVVVDTPPTRHALDFLDAPRRLTRFLDHRLYRMLMAPTRGSVKAVERRRPGVPAHGVEGRRRRRDRRRHRVLPGLRRHGGGLQATGPTRCSSCLRHRQTAFVLVARPGATPSRRPTSSPPACRGRHRRARADRQPHAPELRRRPGRGDARAGPHARRHRPRRALRATSPTSVSSRHARRSTSPAWPSGSRRPRWCACRSCAPTCTTSTARRGRRATCSA